MHKQAKQPRHLGDQVVGWVGIIGLPVCLVWFFFARWAGA